MAMRRELPGDQGGIEINTDGELLGIGSGGDLFDVHDKRFGLAISHFKDTVRGRAYDNESIALRVGRAGYYAQSKRFPLAFFGDSARPDRSEEHTSELQSREKLVC